MSYRRVNRSLSWVWASLMVLSACASVQRPNAANPHFSAQNSAQDVNPKGLQRFLSGSAIDQQPALQGPNLLLAGGGQDQVAAMQWQIDNLRGCSDCDRSLDMVVLRSSGADGYNSMLGELKGVDSIETLVITDRSIAEEPGIAETVARAEVVFFAGGDQCQYVRLFKGTALERAVKSVFARGGGIGGTSAGLAIQGALVYDACQGGISSEEALANPDHERLSFTQGFLDWPQMRLTLTDTHFAQRDRMGRLMAFLAKGSQTLGVKPLRGIAVDEATALAVDRNGIAQVFGKHQVYFVEATALPEVLPPGQALSNARFQIQALRAGDSIDLKQRTLTGAYAIDVRNGQLSANPYRP
jgi:cyanophycinase